MKTNGNTALITGGGSGIGYALAEAFVAAGNKVIICGRSEEKLLAAKNRLPEIFFKACDLSKKEERESFCSWAAKNFKEINVLVNNAGIQRMIDFTQGTKGLFAGEDEIEVNLKAYVHLSAHFIPLFLKQKEAAIINISSGLGFVPLAIMPVYCATKAAVHSFSLSLRHQLKDSPIRVFEVIPPIVDTGLDKGAREKRGQKDRGIQPSEVAAATLKALENNEFETAIGLAQNLRAGSRNNPEKTFLGINR